MLYLIKKCDETKPNIIVNIEIVETQNKTKKHSLTKSRWFGQLSLD